MKHYRHSNIDFFSKFTICWSGWMVRALGTPPGRSLVQFPARAFCGKKWIFHDIWSLLAFYHRTQGGNVTKEFKLMLVTVYTHSTKYYTKSVKIWTPHRVLILRLLFNLDCHFLLWHLLSKNTLFGLSFSIYLVK